VHRFFVESENINNGTARISGSDAKHLKTVMRLGIGDEIRLIDGKGFDYLACIDAYDGADVLAKIIECKKSSAEPELKLTLLQAVPKGDKMDFIVQKCTELGICTIVPCITKRCITKLDEKKAGERVTRWQRIALEAAKQSGRGVIPTVENVVSFEDAVHNISKKIDSLFVIPWELEKSLSMKSVLQQNKGNVNSITFAIGPEGGFDIGEVDFACKNGAIPVSLGSRILRTETAGMVACTITLYEFGEIG